MAEARGGLTLLEGVLAEEQHRPGVPLHLVQARRRAVRPGPEDAALAEALAVDALGRGGEHHAALHEGQQGAQRPLLLAGRQRGGRLRQQDAREAAAAQRRRHRRLWLRRRVEDAHVGAAHLALEDLLAQVVDPHQEGFLG